MTAVPTARAAARAERRAGEQEDPPLRLWFLCSPARLDAAVAERLPALLGELARRGHAVTVAAAPAAAPAVPGWDPARLEAAGCRIQELPALDDGPRLSALRTLRRLAKDSADLLHTTDGTTLAALQRALFGLRRRPPLVHVFGPSSPLERDLAARLRGRGVARVVASSGFAREMLVRRGRIVRRKIEIAPPSVDAARFDPARVEAAEARAEIGIPTSAPVVGLFAADPGGARPDVAVEVAAMVLHQVPDARFLPLGPGSADPVLSRARERGLDARFVAPAPAADPVRLLAAADVAVDAGEAATLRACWLEALAMAVPVVAFEGIAAAAVRHETTGFLAPGGNTRALAAWVVALLRHDERRRSTGGAGRNDVLSRFSVQAQADVYERIYRELLSCVSTVAS